jgi:type II secretory ATPase GspE/PulE/Tfp pilus assembly ATPase PilB-like protein
MDQPTAGAIESHELGTEEIVRRITESRLLTPDWILVAQRHAREQKTSLYQALLELRLIDEKSLERILLSDEPAAVAAASMRGDEATAAGSPAQDERLFERDIRAKLRAVAATAVPSDLADQVLGYAFHCRATDIHLDPRKDRYFVRFRVDGQLHDMVDLDAETGTAVIRAIKVTSRMDILDRRHAHDGGISVKAGGQTRSLRISSLPVVEGEKVVLRILEPQSMTLGLEKIGLEPDQVDTLNDMLAQSYGAIFVGGPVGSGKTTTLYSALDRLNHPSRNVMSIEDPVEYRFKGVNQVEIDSKSGMSFPEGLRAILRQDPNVLMIGEVRDEETATIGIRAALTGVLVLSTVHASDAPSVIGVLRNFGIPGYSLASALQGVVSQRLVRRICEQCRTPYTPSPKVLKALKLDPEEHAGLALYHGRGCAACFQTGYFGRTGIFELLPLSTFLRDLVLQETPAAVIRAFAIEDGTPTLRDGAIRKVIQGVTTVEEMYRVTS